MRFIRAVSGAVCAAMLLSIAVPQAVGSASDNTGVYADTAVTVQTAAVDNSAISAAVVSLQSFYQTSQSSSRSTSVSRVLAGADQVDRRLFGTTAWRASAQTAAQVGAQTTRLITLNQISMEDYETLLKIVEAEATGGDIHSKMLIAGVVMNRVRDSRFPDTITEVVWDRSSDGAAQFSPTADGRINSVQVTEETIEAVRRVLAGEDYTEGALFFVARSTANARALYWFDSNLEVLFAYGGHDFFKFYEDDADAEGTVSGQADEQ